MTGVGEPFLNRHFLKMLQYLKSKSVKVVFADNFTLLVPKIAEKLVSMQINEIGISLDGATKETYESIRLGANFEKVMNNVKNLIALKNKMNSSLPELYIIFTLSDRNIHEAPLMVDLARSLGCWLKILKVKTFEETKDQSIDIENEKTKKILKQVVKRAREMDVYLEFCHFTKQPIQRCDWPWKTCYITYDGFVYPCCYVLDSDNREDRVRSSFGNIFEVGFGKVWESERAKQTRKQIQRGEIPAICKDCRMFG